MNKTYCTAIQSGLHLSSLLWFLRLTREKKPSFKYDTISWKKRSCMQTVFGESNQGRNGPRQLKIPKWFLKFWQNYSPCCWKRTRGHIRTYSSGFDLFCLISFSDFVSQAPVSSWGKYSNWHFCCESVLAQKSALCIQITLGAVWRHVREN